MCYDERLSKLGGLRAGGHRDGRADGGDAMKLIERTITIPTRGGEFRLIPFGCLHADSEGHRKGLWDQCREELLKPNTYGIGAGDYRDLLRTTAMRYLRGYNADRTSMKSVDDLVRESTIDFYHEYFKGLEAKIIGLGKGNHLYEYQEGDNDTQQLCRLLNVPYLDNPSFIRLVVKTPDGRTVNTLRILLHHGNWSGGSSRPGGSVNAAEMKAAGFDFDIYIFSHDHRKWAMHIPTLTIPKRGELEVVERPRCFIRTGCFVAGYDKKCGDGNYVQDKLMHPSDLGYVTLTVKFYREYDAVKYKREQSRQPTRKARELRGAGVGRDKYKFKVEF